MSGTMTSDALIARLEAALSAARATGAAEVEASWEGTRQGVLRFAASQPTQAMITEEGKLRVRVALDGGRVGAALTGSLDDDALVQAARAAHALATAAPTEPRWAGFAPRDPALATDGDDGAAATRAAGPAERAALLAQMAAEATPHALVLAGRLSTDQQTVAVATTAGASA